MRAWLKGGLIGIGFSVIFMIVAIIFNANFLGDFLAKISFWFSSPFVYLFQMLGLDKTGENYGLIVIFIFLGLALEFFILGSLIGWIIGKVKSKNKQSENY